MFGESPSPTCCYAYKLANRQLTIASSSIRSTVNQEILIVEIFSYSMLLIKRTHSSSIDTVGLCKIDLK